jgi:hypothetical protein
VFVNLTVVTLQWGRRLCKLDCSVLAVRQIYMKNRTVVCLMGTDVFVNSTVVCLQWDRCVCK